MSYEPIIEIRSSPFLKGACVFKGVPYAAPPTGPNRWRPPQPAARWEGTRDTHEFGPHFPQAANPRFRAPRHDEDCLYLNVWTLSTIGPRGGRCWCGCTAAASSPAAASDLRCDGTRLASEGSVVVSFNYRSACSVSSRTRR